MPVNARGVPLSVLDQSPIPEGSTGEDALRNTIELAQLADSLGFARYWVAEHHGTPMLAGASLPYAFADFINPDGAAIARRYRDEFVASHTNSAARVMVCSWVICAESDEEARRLASSTEMSMRLLFRGELIPVPPVEKALAFLAAEGSSPLPIQGAWPRRRIVGSPATVRDKIEALIDEYGAARVMVVTITHNHAARCRSYEMLASTFGLH